MHDLIARMRKLVDSYGERLLIGEVYLPTERLMAYYGPDADGTHMPYNFQLILLPWEARTIDAAVARYEAALPKSGWPNWVLGNHDKPRVMSRVGQAQARVAAMLLLTLRGTPTLYYGDEIGMVDVPIPPGRIRDPFEIREPGRGNGRDPQRTPMQWSAEANAGFTSGDPWLPIPASCATTNVEVQRDDPDSLLTFYRRLILLRTTHLALAVGSYEPLHADGELLAFRRRHGTESFLCCAELVRHVRQLHSSAGPRAGCRHRTLHFSRPSPGRTHSGIDPSTASRRGGVDSGVKRVTFPALSTSKWHSKKAHNPMRFTLVCRKRDTKGLPESDKSPGRKGACSAYR